jgi:hypothetical protein
VPFEIRILNPQRNAAIVPQRVAPVRFARAVAGFSDETAPDIDDHAFTLPRQFCTVHGPAVGVMQGDTVRVRVLRDRLEDTALLFATVDDSNIASIDFPVANSPLVPIDVPTRPRDCVFVKGAATGAAEQETKLSVRFGAANGPIVAQLAVRVYPVLTVRVQAHAVSINGQAPTTTFAQLQQIFDDPNRATARDVRGIYAQSGLRFVLQPNLMNEVVNGFARPGTVTLTNVADQQNTELQTVLRQNPVPNMLNAYLIGHYFDTTNGLTDRVLGIAFSTDDASANPPNPLTGFPGCQAGITFRDTPDLLEAAHTVAHEIGHSLRLQHYALGNGSNNSPNDIRHDIWAHRCLMHNIVGLGPGGDAGNRFKSTPARIRVGYGSLANGTALTGQLITTKDRAEIQQSDQVNVVRRAQEAGTCFPV